MTPELFEMTLTCARTLLAHRDAGRSCDPRSIEWAETLLAANPTPKVAVSRDDSLPEPQRIES